MSIPVSLFSNAPMVQPNEEQTPETVNLKRQAEIALDLHSNIEDLSLAKKSRISDPLNPFEVCVKLIDVLSEHEDSIIETVYNTCLPTFLKDEVDDNTVIDSDLLESLLSEKEVKEVNFILKWYLLITYGEVCEHKEVGTELQEIKKFLEITSLHQILRPYHKKSVENFYLTLESFLDKLTPFFGLETYDGDFCRCLHYLVARNIEDQIKADEIVVDCCEAFEIPESSLTNSCCEYLSKQTIEFRARFALLINLFKLKFQDEYDQIHLELRVSVLIFEPPIKDLFLEIRNFIENCESNDEEEICIVSSAKTELGHLKFAKLNVPGHPNWMPNGGNSCYISATLWPLFLLLDSQIKATIEEFEKPLKNEGKSVNQTKEMKKAQELFSSLYRKIAAESIESIETHDVNQFRRAVQLAYPDQFVPNSISQEDACDFLVWVVNDLLGFRVKDEESPKFVVLHTFCRTSEEPLPDVDHYDYKEALVPSYNNQSSYILDLRLDEGTIHKASLFEFITISRETETIERNAYKIGAREGPKYHSFETHHSEQILVESKENAPTFFVGRVARFTLDMKLGVKRKRFDQVYPNATLEFKVKGKEEEEDSVSYDLVAMTVHSGRTITSGHYYCYFRTEIDGILKFVKYDDIEGPCVCNDDNKVIEDAAKNGYLFYYKKRAGGQNSPPPLPFEDIL